MSLPASSSSKILGEGIKAYVLDFPASTANPWHTQWRPGGLDFFADGQRLALCTWIGDVWLVEGLTGPQQTWRRIAAGLNQALGLKIIDDVIHITCRDQIVKLRDLNGGGETDFYECFNSDHQVTEHFHEFTMGLQTDAAGNFYYAKSARHAKPPLVPHHGTLLRISKDGTKTQIVANGFRAANGVSVNDDGTFYVTDQEGHWTPKNRINLVRESRFYGNMWSYNAPEDKADTAMEQLLVWLMNEFDRSPGELVRVTPKSWAPLQNKLLDISYGMGRMNLILQDESDPAQGAAVALPMPDFPTGVMRGRFHPVTGDLYTCGMAVWASNKTQDGGIYRVRLTAEPLHFPVRWVTGKGSITITFSDPLDKASAEDVSHYALKVWGPPPQRKLRLQAPQRKPADHHRREARCRPMHRRSRRSRPRAHARAGAAVRAQRQRWESLHEEHPRDDSPVGGNGTNNVTMSQESRRAYEGFQQCLRHLLDDSAAQTDGIFLFATFAQPARAEASRGALKSS